ncbi:hypothetical protein CCUS01_12620 [Colletotrichum cuscutae]|uniref:Uncharacterized protein n=1 Tax=Colletotrichum cuscutae TaxID=1209917 RepID=A0AAI9TVH0_9PEZI|nr:hypothetical protein CCUS01_12620 [Colletotrichum cuscutae]
MLTTNNGYDSEAVLFHMFLSYLPLFLRPVYWRWRFGLRRCHLIGISRLRKLMGGSLTSFSGLLEWHFLQSTSTTHTSLFS